jgi:hypothetical protein
VSKGSAGSFKRSETDVAAASEIMSQDLAGVHNSEVVEEVGNPRGVGASAEETPLPMHCETPRVVAASALVD